MFFGIFHARVFVFAKKTSYFDSKITGYPAIIEPSNLLKPQQKSISKKFPYQSWGRNEYFVHLEEVLTRRHLRFFFYTFSSNHRIFEPHELT